MIKNNVLLLVSIFFTNYGFSSPNILIILADDLGWNDVSYHGSEIDTPNIDSLISSGVELDRFYVQPTCSPTRAELMTGKSAIRLGITRPISKNQKLGLGLNEKILPEYLKEMSYQTYLLGKWHLGAYTPEYFPTRRGFDYFYGYLQGGNGYWDHVHGGGYDWQKNEKLYRKEGYTTHLIRDDAIRIIENHDDQSSIFLNINFGAPHTPNEAPQESINKFKDIDSENRRIHAAMVHEMDDAIGQIINALKEKNILNNTIIFFASDNGGLPPNLELDPGILNLPYKLGICDWERPLSFEVFEWLCSNFDGASSNMPLPKGKMSVSEGGIRVPAAIWWPDKIEQDKTTNFISMIDILPTIIDLVDYKSEINVDGNSQANILMNTGESQKTKYAVIDVTNNVLSLVDMPYKLISSNGEYELFNIINDPTETINIAEIYPDLVEKYSQELSNLPRGENRSLPLPEILRDPDLFGGEEDRIPWVEKAFENAEVK